MSAIDITKPVSGNPTTQSVRDNFAAAASEIDALDAAVTILEASVSGFDSHLIDTNNPHVVTKTQIGLGNVDNTSDVNKPISTATQAALDAKQNVLGFTPASSSDLAAHTSNTSNPHSVTKSQIGLGNVDNTSDLNKPISTATQAALDAKQNTLTNSDGLSEGTTNLYFTNSRVISTLLAGLSTATNAVITVSDTILSALGKLQKQVSDNLTALVNHTGNTNNPHSVTKTQVGLSNVDNTSDLNKPISTATQTALNGKQNTLTNSDGLSEGTTNLYFTGARVLSTLLVGLSTATNAVITASDSVLSALGKLQKQISDNLTTLTSHTGNTSNPHSVTKTQVGLSNVDNTSDANKPISTAAQTALNSKADSSALSAHVVDTGNPHNTNAAQVGAVAKAGDTMTGALNWATTQTIASAATVDLSAATSNSIIVSGSVTITSFGSPSPGAEFCIAFSGTPTLTHNASTLILPGGANITAAAGDVAHLIGLSGGGVRVTSYSFASGQKVTGNLVVAQTAGVNSTKQFTMSHDGTTINLVNNNSDASGLNDIFSVSGLLIGGGSTQTFGFDNAGRLFSNAGDLRIAPYGISTLSVNTNYMAASVRDDGCFAFSSNANPSDIPDTRLYRGKPGRMDVCTTNNSTYGDVKLRDLYLTGANLVSSVADGASAVGFDFSTSSYTTAGALVARLRNNATTVFSVDKDGAGFIRGPLTIGTSAAASGLSFPGSGATTTLTVSAYGDNLTCNRTLIGAEGLQVYSGSIYVRSGSGGVVLGSGHHYGFSSSTDGAAAAADTRLYRGTAGRFDVCTSNSSTYGDIKLRSLISSGGVITLSASTVAGLLSATLNPDSIAVVTDASSPVIGSTVVGGGSTRVLVQAIGGNWVVIGGVGATGALTNFTEAVNTAAPNATVPVVSLTATNAAANVDIALVPKGTGAITAHIADGTATGGNKRGAGAVDLQMVRSAATEVASGPNSFIVGTHNQASGSGAAAFGVANIISGPLCFASGARNTVSSGGGGACAFGWWNSVSGTASMAVGSYNTADADNSIAAGWYATSRGIASTMQHAGSRRVADGDRQFRRIPQSTVTSNATATVLTSTGAAESTGNTWVVPANYSGILHGFVVARNTVSNDTIGWEIKAMVSRDSTAASVAILGSASVAAVGTADASMSSCGIAVAANTTNGSITITATGLAATTIAWSGYLHCIENG